MANAGKLWSDISLMQDLEDQLSSSGSILESTNTLIRGSESYSIPKDASFPDRDFSKNEEVFFSNNVKLFKDSY